MLQTLFILLSLYQGRIVFHVKLQPAEYWHKVNYTGYEQIKHMIEFDTFYNNNYCIIAGLSYSIKVFYKIFCIFKLNSLEQINF